jgi:hypothetical protein
MPSGLKIIPPPGCEQWAGAMRLDLNGIRTGRKRQLERDRNVIKAPGLDRHPLDRFDSITYSLGTEYSGEAQMPVGLAFTISIDRSGGSAQAQSRST